jgi:hypothetical protein
MKSQFRNVVIFTCALSLLVLTPNLLADGGPNHQEPSTEFGVSGGNINDRTNRFCCSGTLGALVTGGGANYILSNNHVLARTDAAAIGEDISQPGLIDNNCAIPPIVADLSAFVPLGNNVDAAIAQLRAGAMNTTGSIMDIGTISSVVRAPAVGLSVAKSGRTTGLTTGTISAINASINVQYQRGCGKGKKFVVSYTGQVVITGSSFSAGGDSGSLIVSNNNCHQPVALLYAGSSTTTIGNPIGEVLTKLSSELGPNLSFVGNNCTARASSAISDTAPHDDAVSFATTAMRSREKNLMSRAGVIGVGVGSDDQTNGAAIVVFVDQNRRAPRLPGAINGVPVRVIPTEPFVAR